MTERRDLPAGGFSAWLRRTRAALLGEGGADVPCGECSACCTTSHFVHVGPEETQTLARIPRELLFSAPGLSAGNVVLGYDEQGHCPMLADGRCSIYEQRPLTCRTYDCRVFAAAGITADREPITRQVRRWKFGHPTPDDRAQHVAVRAAATFVREHAECFPGGAGSRDPALVAVLAIKVCDVFLEPGDESGATGRASSDLDVARAVMEVNERFEAARAAAQASPDAGRCGAAAAAGRAVRQGEPDG
jgi:uncharacterized protein